MVPYNVARTRATLPSRITVPNVAQPYIISTQNLSTGVGGNVTRCLRGTIHIPPPAFELNSCTGPTTTSLQRRLNGVFYN